MPPRPEDNTEKVTKTSNQITQHFKNVGLRKAEFKREKSKLVEKELQAHFKAEHDARRQEAESLQRSKANISSASQGALKLSGSPADAPAASPKSNHGLARSMSSPTSAIGFGSRPSTPGTVVNRFGASYPLSNHPSVHPGAVSSRPPSQGRASSSVSRPRGTPPSAGSEQSSQHRGSVSQARNSVVFQALGPLGNEREVSQVLTEADSMELAGFSSSASAASALQGAARARSRTDSSTAGFAAGASPQRPETSGSLVSTETRRRGTNSRVSLGLVSFSGADADDVEDPLWGTDFSREEQLFLAAEEETAALSMGCQGGKRHPDPPDMIERLGDLMALLGPRYRTLPREEVWQKAVVGATTPLQRREKRLGHAAAHSISGFPKPRGRGGRTGKSRHRSPERAPDHDPDGIARSAWLKARDFENERKSRGKTDSPSSRVSALAPSMHLSIHAL
eukprot:gb/GFBE01082734.1/.p1 GENE.gb/GFBE01082734.1/~~gb/GFBE01082734.1/.p1  ORF type:complete len:452 (+),score=35.05 gb/GFBE01082734.1/:1-1356(+)